ncbi:hypothetical protein E2C01_029612 [Portunus trituberculatus]|uniref:Uncharacterized protein n=1 Tax=Portunus trituberculatus TaxID=210409 RepID=A0A5B7ETE1_PORTR|nr:hypothetical protein [Portunus trituberculatus]
MNVSSAHDSIGVADGSGRAGERGYEVDESGVWRSGACLEQHNPSRFPGVDYLARRLKHC